MGNKLKVKKNIMNGAIKTTGQNTLYFLFPLLFIVKILLITSGLSINLSIKNGAVSFYTGKSPTPPLCLTLFDFYAAVGNPVGTFLQTFLKRLLCRHAGI